jgi:hypothetical protein
MGLENEMQWCKEKRRMNKIKNTYYSLFFLLSPNAFLKSKRGKRLLTIWSKNVRIRDRYTCQRCGSSTRLHAHHIFPKSQIPKLAFRLNNGVTLCDVCHKTFHTIYGYKYKNGHIKLREFLKTL